jgi:phage-related protein
MTTIRMQFKKWPVISGFSMFFLAGTFAGAQSASGTNPQDNSRSAQDRDITRRELANFDEFLDSHREIAEQVRKDPSLLDNQQFLKDHPDLQRYLWNHPGVRGEVKENATAFMRAENRYDRPEDAAAREKLASFDQFLDKHHEIAEQVRRNPSLLDDQQYLKDHPELQTYLQDHTGVRNAVRENPTAFMRAEDRYDQRDDARKNGMTDARDTGDRDTTRGQVASFDQFLDKHREVAEQVRKDPSLLDNQQFLKDHPALQTYLRDHQGVREEIQENPTAFMRQENRYDRTEAERGGDLGAAHRHFGEFLGHHTDISRDLDKDASLVKKDDYVRRHPELQAYLSAHPEVRQELLADPHGFVKSTQQWNTKTPPVKTTTAPTTAQPKP